MNILNKISVAASIAAAAILSSCSDKGYWDEAPLVAGMSFPCKTYNESLSPGENQIVIPLTRTVNAAEETVNITFTPAEDCPDDITVPSSVTFSAGSNSADIVITVADANPPSVYAGTLEFQGEPSYSGISKLTLNCPVSYVWVSLGMGTFFDAFVMDGAEEDYSVEILKAEGFDRYRVIAPYKEYYTTIGPEYNDEGWIDSTGPEYVEFYQRANGNLYFLPYDTGLNYDGDKDAPIMAYPWNYFNNTSDGLDIWYEPGFAVLSPVYYIPDVGSYGQLQYAVQIGLPE